MWFLSLTTPYAILADCAVHAAHLYVKAGLCTTIGSPLGLHDTHLPVLLVSCSSPFASFKTAACTRKAFHLDPRKLNATTPVL